MTKPRIFLVPVWTELEWTIRPLLEEWAEVASYDPTGGTGAHAEPELSRQWLVDRGLEELDALGWEGCTIVADHFGAGTALRIASARPTSVHGVALGHATPSWDSDGERPPINEEVWAAMVQLLKTDYGNFVRNGLSQLTQGSYDPELADAMLERVPVSYMRSSWELIRAEPEPIPELIASLDCSLLFARHGGCLLFNDEGFEDIVARFPDARTTVTEKAPSADPGFAAAVRSLAEEIAAGT